MQGKKQRDFIQSFFLATQEKGYYVLNDTLRFLSNRFAHPSAQPKENYSTQHNQALQVSPPSLSWGPLLSLPWAFRFMLQARMSRGGDLDYQHGGNRTSHSTAVLCLDVWQPCLRISCSIASGCLNVDPLDLAS